MPPTQYRLRLQEICKKIAKGQKGNVRYDMLRNYLRQIQLLGNAETARRQSKGIEEEL